MRYEIFNKIKSGSSEISNVSREQPQIKSYLVHDLICFPICSKLELFISNLPCLNTALLRLAAAMLFLCVLQHLSMIHRTTENVLSVCLNQTLDTRQTDVGVLCTTLLSSVILIYALLTSNPILLVDYVIAIHLFLITKDVIQQSERLYW